MNPILPRSADNNYRGHPLGPWFFGLVVLLKAGVGVDAIVNGAAMAGLGDGIALGAMAPGGSRAVVSLFAVWGFTHLVVCLMCLGVLARYRTLIPCMFALLLLEHAGRRLVLHFLPLAAAGPAGASPGISPFPYGFAVLIAVGLALSLTGRGDGGGGG
jgi:hypothetical protein